MSLNEQSGSDPADRSASDLVNHLRGQIAESALPRGARPPTVHELAAVVDHPRQELVGLVIDALASTAPLTAFEAAALDLLLQEHARQLRGSGTEVAE